MLLKHSALYGLARGVPGIISFLAIVIYTRLLNPETYGLYALVIAGVGLFDSVLFQWLRSSLLRFLPAYKHKPQVLLSTCFIGFLAMVMFSAMVGVLMLLSISNPEHKSLIAIAMVLLWVSAWYELNLELVRAKLSPMRYGAMSIFKTLLALVMGTILVLQGFAAFGPLLGVITGALLAALILARQEWKYIGIKLLDKNLFRELLRYGLPLTATFALMFFVTSTDRFLLAWFLGTEAAGLYAPAYDLTQFSLSTIMVIVNLAAYPLAIHALEQQGEDAARKQLQKNGLLLFGIAVPATLGLVICAENIASVVLGESFQDTASMLIPIISLAALFAGAKSCFLDLSFQLGRRTMGQVWVMLAAALTNVTLNIWWIPLYGLLGAAYATLIAYGVAFVLSWLLGRKIFRLPAFPVEGFKIIAASLLMALSLWPTLDLHGWLALIWQIVLACSVYLAALLAFNIVGSRQRVHQILLKHW